VLVGIRAGLRGIGTRFRNNRTCGQALAIPYAAVCFKVRALQKESVEHCVCSACWHGMEAGKEKPGQRKSLLPCACQACAGVFAA
jgi:hypothetical protein